MKSSIVAHIWACALLASILTGTGSNASILDKWGQVSLPQLPFLSTAQSIISALKPESAAAPKKMTLRNVYHQGTHSYRGLSARYDFPTTEQDSSAQWWHNEKDAETTAIKTTRVKTWRPKDVTAFTDAHRRGDEARVRATSRAMDWDEIEVDAPDVTDRQTLLALAKMASKAYDAPKNTSGSDWTTGGGKWNLSESFGWVEDGIRGHIFATDDNSTIVVALKGTSAALLDDGSTSKRDKENDNLLFSCCCAHVGWTWHTVCDCYEQAQQSSAPPTLHARTEEKQRCASNCLTKALIEKSFYYPATTDLFNNISYAYPDAQIWVTGHSLGGALGALIGMTFGYPTVTFEAPAERMAAVRLHLPLPVKHDNMDALPITHVYHTADPIPMGECVGATSLCANFGFAMESRCHSGKTVLYDTVGKLNWASSVVKHRIASLIDEILDEDWDKKVEKASSKAKISERDGSQSTQTIWTSRWRLPWSRNNSDDTGDQDKEKKKKLTAVPKLRSEKNCRDCSDWKFIDDDKDDNDDSIFGV